MSLQAAFRSSQSALAANAFQTATLSRNVSGAGSLGYVRKIALVETSVTGTASATRVARATDLALQNAVLTASATAQGDEAVSKALESLQTIFGDPADGASPSARISNLKAALLQAASAPQDAAGLASAVSAAQSLATTLNDASDTVQQARLQADRDMAASVSTINSLLASFGQTNAAIVAGQAAGQDVTDALDRRDALLDDLAKQVSISTIQDSNGGMSIYTDSGVALFQGAARTVSMASTQTYTAGANGQAVYIDGVAVTGPAAAMPLKAGVLAGLSTFRDTIATGLQSQLDEIATGLVSAFVQTPAAGSSLEARTGLFAWSGSPATPAHGVAGIAAAIHVDPSVIDDPSPLRDGGIGNDPAYVSNPNGSFNYSSRLYALADALGASQSFQAAGLPSRLSVVDLASQSEAWFERARQEAADQATNSNASLVQATAALSNATGVNIDDQMSQMLDLENSYQASAKMLATIDSMYAALFSALQPS
ncbi:MAG TPA: flagellar hook-associated protein FlgK [Rhodoblastus sp.]|nr:flagellar hook-associated protein FlgK [Rhodoblastus sp.]